MKTRIEDRGRVNAVAAINSALSAFLIVLGCTLAGCNGGGTAADRSTAPAPEQREESSPMEYVLLSTNQGEVVLELDPQRAPITVGNFLEYVDAGFYNGTIFHRVIPGFMVQGGGFTADMNQKETRKPIRNEWQNGLKNARGTIAMARTQEPDSASAQFFINVADNDSLDQPISGGAGYAVFGRVVDGMDTIDSIVAVQTTSRGPHQNVPVEPVIIQEAKRLSDKDAKDRIG